MGKLRWFRAVVVLLPASHWFGTYPARLRQVFVQQRVQSARHLRRQPNQ